MTVQNALRTLGERWLVVVAGMVAGLLVGGLIAVLTPNSYRSESSIYVAASDTTGGAQAAYEGSLLSQQRVKSYTEIMMSQRVLDPVVSTLHLPETTAQLASLISVDSSTDSTILSVAVEDRSPERAAAIANAMAASFSTVVGQLEQPSLGGGQRAVDTKVVDAAVPDYRPVSPRVALDLLVGLVFGLLLGAGTALVGGLTDRRIRTSATLRSLTGAAVLGELPYEDAPAYELAALPASPRYREAVRRIRANAFLGSTGSRVVTVAGAAAREGRTTVLCSLATTLAATRRVAIVDANLTTPALAERLYLGTTGLTDVLAGHVAVKEAVQRWGAVDVLTAGVAPEDPGALLGSPEMEDMLDDLRSTYDVILVDTAALLESSDAVIVASRADGTVLVCQDGAGTTDEVTEAVETLGAAHARVLGSVLTMTGARRRVGRLSRDRRVGADRRGRVPAVEAAPAAPALGTFRRPRLTDGTGRLAIDPARD